MLVNMGQFVYLPMIGIILQWEMWFCQTDFTSTFLLNLPNPILLEITLGWQERKENGFSANEIPFALVCSIFSDPYSYNQKNLDLCELKGRRSALSSTCYTDFFQPFWHTHSILFILNCSYEKLSPRMKTDSELLWEEHFNWFSEFKGIASGWDIWFF